MGREEYNRGYEAGKGDTVSRIREIADWLGYARKDVEEVLKVFEAEGTAYERQQGLRGEPHENERGDHGGAIPRQITKG